MNKITSPKIIALTFGILVICFAIAFYVIAWQEPSETPPEGNVPTPLNVGPLDQIKQGGLSIGGDIKDGLGNIIYNASTHLIERERLPFEQGDITSDVDTNTWDGGYFDVSNLVPGNVKAGVSFGRGQVGEMPQGYTRACLNTRPNTCCDIGSGQTGYGPIEFYSAGGCNYPVRSSITCSTNGNVSGHTPVCYLNYGVHCPDGKYICEAYASIERGAGVIIKP